MLKPKPRQKNNKIKNKKPLAQNGQSALYSSTISPLEILNWEDKWLLKNPTGHPFFLLTKHIRFILKVRGLILGSVFLLHHALGMLHKY